jgi:CubicO group peptidase (beta-lactamase class C family)
VDLRGLIDCFEENFAKYGEVGASVCVIHEAETVLNIGDGFFDRTNSARWTTSTRVLIWSATKALTSACLLHCCDQSKIALSQRVIEFWPEYGANGKADTTLSQILAHQAGQPALRDPKIQISDHDAVVRALAAQTPFWTPGDGHGYHPRTYGFLVDELLRRISSGLTVAQYFRQMFGDPLGLDLWIGIPEHLVHDVAPIQAPRRPREPSFEDPFYQALADPNSLVRLAFSTPAGSLVPSALNEPEIRMHPLPSFGAIGTAESLARFYYHVLGEPGHLSSKMLSTVAATIFSGRDRILQIPTAFGLGFMKDPISSTHQKQREIFGPSKSAFGQPGAGGSHAFVDPEQKLAFAYLMNQMEPGLLPNRKSLRLVDRLYADGA